MRRNMRRIAKEMTKQIKQGSTGDAAGAAPTEVTYDEPNFMNAGASQLVK